MNLFDMEITLRKQLGNPTETDITRDDLYAVLNRSYKWVMDTYKFHIVRERATFNTMLGVDKYSIPANGFTIFSIRDNTSNNKLVKRTPDWFDALSSNSAQGVPSDYCRYANYIQINPVPDGIYSIQVYFKFAVDSLGLSDEPLAPTTWHEGMIKRARYIFWDDQGDIGKAQYAMASWKEWIETKPEELSEETYHDQDFRGVAIGGLVKSAKRQDFNHAD